MAYLVRIIDHILGGLSTSQWLQASNHPHAFFHKIHIKLKHNFTKLESIQEIRIKNWTFKNTLDRAKEHLAHALS